jgi:hypothetical protein
MWHLKNIEESSARTLELRCQRTKWVHFLKAPMLRNHRFFRSLPELLNCQRDREIPDSAVVGTNRRLQNSKPAGCMGILANFSELFWVLAESFTPSVGTNRGSLPQRPHWAANLSFR